MRNKKLLCLLNNNSGGCKLPAKDDLQAVYLNKKAPSSAGVVTNESEGADARLVNSTCGKFDGTVYGITPTGGSVHTGTKVIGAVLFKPTDLTDSQVIFAKSTAGQHEFFLHTTGGTGTLNFYLSGNGVALELAVIGTVFVGTVYDFKLSFDNGVLSYSLNGATGSHTFTFDSIYNGTAKIALGKRSDLVYKYTGEIYYAQFGNAEFNLAEGAGDTLYNTGTAGGNATLTGATLDDFWSERQDVHHKNILDGFSNALAFDGVNDYVDLYSSESNFNDLTEGEVEFYVKVSGASSLGMMISTSDSGDPNSEVSFFLTSAGNLRLIIRDAGVYSLGWTSTNSINDGNWHRVSYFSNIDGNIISLDGNTSSGAYTKGDSSVQAFFNSVSGLDAFRLGNRITSDTDEHYFRGSISNVSLKNIAGQTLARWGAREGDILVNSIAGGPDGTIYGAGYLRLPAKNSTHDILDNELTNPAGK